MIKDDKSKIENAANRAQKAKKYFGWSVLIMLILPYVVYLCLPGGVKEHFSLDIIPAITGGIILLCAGSWQWYLHPIDNNTLKAPWPEENDYIDEEQKEYSRDCKKNQSDLKKVQGQIIAARWFATLIAIIGVIALLPQPFLKWVLHLIPL